MDTRSLACAMASCLLFWSFTAQSAHPVIVPGQSFDLSENLPAGTVLGTVQASDPDGDPFILFVKGDAQAQWGMELVPFAIDPVTRELRTTRMLN